MNEISKDFAAVTGFALLMLAVTLFGLYFDSLTPDEESPRTVSEWVQ